MIFFPLIVLAAVTFLIPWLSVIVNEQIPQLSAQLYKYLSPPETPLTPDVIDQFIKENGGLENITGQHPLNSGPHDALQDVNIFIEQTKELLYTEGAVLYDKYAPQLVRDKVEEGYDILHSDEIWPYYQKYENVLHIAMTGISILILLKVLKAIISFFASSEPVDESKKRVPVTVFTEKDFETIPLCVGKGDAEELLVANNYAEILRMSNDESFLKKYDMDADTTSDSFSKSSILRSQTPTKYDSPTSFTNSDISAIFKDDKLETPIKLEVENNSDKSSSTSPDDSFQRQEDLLDEQLTKLNSTNMVTSTSSGSNSIDKNSTSPAKLVYKKTSISIMTDAAFPNTAAAKTTVGDITEATVYSEPFASDENSSFVNSL